MHAWLALANPLDHPLHLAGLELAILGSFVVTLRHAVGRYRQGERPALLMWLAAFAYGIAMELIAFNFLHNYEHAQFTVQLYHQKIPFYVVCLYPVFLYTGYAVVVSWELPALAEALLGGFVMCLVDVPFDIAGAAVGWWRWLDTDPNLAVRWLGVPVTSYYWYLTFGAVYMGIGRLLRRRAQGWPLWRFAVVAPLAGVAVIVLGTIAFLPMHGLHALGVGNDVVVLAHLGGCVLVAASVRPPRGAMTAVAAIPVVLGAWHVGVLAVAAAAGQVTQAPLKLGMATAAWCGVVALVARPLARRRQMEEAR